MHPVIKICRKSSELQPKRLLSVRQRNEPKLLVELLATGMSSARMSSIAMLIAACPRYYKTILADTEDVVILFFQAISGFISTNYRYLYR
jgi:hypothetical protein